MSGIHNLTFQLFLRGLTWIQVGYFQYAKSMVLKGGLKYEVCQGQVHRHGAREHRPKELQEKVTYEYQRAFCEVLVGIT